MTRGCLNYLFAMVALVGVCLLASAVYLHGVLRHTDNIVGFGAVRVSASVTVSAPTWAPWNLPESSARPTAPATVPPDPGRGPEPLCWITGPRPGEPCPPKP